MGQHTPGLGLWCLFLLWNVALENWAYTDSCALSLETVQVQPQQHWSCSLVLELSLEEYLRCVTMALFHEALGPGVEQSRCNAHFWLHGKSVRVSVPFSARYLLNLVSNKVIYQKPTRPTKKLRVFLIPTVDISVVHKWEHNHWQEWSWVTGSALWLALADEMCVEVAVYMPFFGICAKFSVIASPLPSKLWMPVSKLCFCRVGFPNAYDEQSHLIDRRCECSMELNQLFLRSWINSGYLLLQHSFIIPDWQNSMKLHFPVHGKNALTPTSC